MNGALFIPTIGGAAAIRVLLVGIGYALSAGLQPGPLQAFFLAKVTEQGWRRTLPAAFAPLLSDGPIALVAILALQALPAGFRNILQLAGGMLLLYFAWSAYQNWQQPQTDLEGSSHSAPRTIRQAALVNLLNPNPYLGWSLVMGPAVIGAWEEGPWLAAVLLLAFYITMIGTSLVIIFLMGQALAFGPNTRKSLSLVSALLLAGLGIYFLIQAGGGIWQTFL
jgi:threonine/homoserine/homoserine lactone efflux protein